ncbi:MAG TPA: hypothetical protein VG870_10605 [Chitinophagaceae bacterium]|nr:hypothetical protein [Chitinophagaceae bacterium]
MASLNRHPSRNAANLRRSRLYSEELGIALGRKTDTELFKWLLASILLGAPINESVAKRSWFSFRKYRLLSPRRILRAGWEFLVNPVLREGHYVRYDEKTAALLLEICRFLLDQYGGSLNALIRTAESRREVRQRLLAIPGIGPVRMNIFLRELRPYYSNCDIPPLPVVHTLARRAGVRLDAAKRGSMGYCRMEAGLMRLRHSLLR